MAVEIPVVKRADAMAPIAQEQVNLQAPSLKDTSAQREGFGDLVEGGIDSYNQYQKTKLSVYDLKSTDKANQFESAMKARLAEIKSKEGDTTQDYIQFDQDMQKLAEEMTTGDEPYGQEYKDILTRKLFSTSSKLRGSRDVQQSAQQYAYRKKVMNDNIKLNQENMLEYGSFVDISKPETFTQMDTFRDLIIQNRMADADQRGTLVRREDGTVDWNQGDVGSEIRTDIGKAIKPLVNGLNNLGKVEEAQEVLSRYSDYLNPSDRLSLLNDTRKSNVKRQALINLQSKGYNMTFAEIDDLDVDPEVKAQMRTQLSIRNKQYENETNSRRKATFETAARSLEEMQASSNAYASFAEYADTPEYKRIQGSITAKDRKALKNIIEKPTSSDPVSFNTLLSKISDESILDMDAADREALLYDLNPTDQRSMRLNINRLVSGKSDTGINAATNRAYKSLDAAMLTVKDSDGNPLFKTDKEGKLVLTKTTMKQYTEIKADIQKQMDSVKGNWKKSDFDNYLNQAVNNLTTARNNDRLGFFSGGERKEVKPLNYVAQRKTLSTTNSRKTMPNASNNPQVPASQPATTGRKLNPANTDDRKELIRLYKEANPNKNPSGSELVQFKNQRGL